VLADADGAIQQQALMDALPFLRGKSSMALGALKSHVNAACKALDRAPLLAPGSGSGPWQVHEIDRALGPLRRVVIEVARTFEIRWDLLERPAEAAAPRPGPAPAPAGPGRTPPAAPRSPDERKGWFVVPGPGGPTIGAFADQHGSCSWRRFEARTGGFLDKRYGRGSFREVFAAVLAGARPFTPPFQPNLTVAEKEGLPEAIVSAAGAAGG
jgi:hypothetical protein